MTSSEVGMKWEKFKIRWRISRTIRKYKRNTKRLPNCVYLSEADFKIAFSDYCQGDRFKGVKVFIYDN